MIVILAQTGSYVPAEEAKVGVLDAVLPGIVVLSLQIIENK